MRAAPGRAGDARRRRIGLLGGSFNPAHAGHAHVARTALRALRLHQVWLMVSPGNPLKPAAGMAPFAQRLASAARQADGVRVIATDIEARLGSRHTHRTLGLLARRFRRARFVLILGADNLLQLPRWRRWREVAARADLAVLPRPGYSRAALHGRAAVALRARRRRPGALLAGPGPCWSFVPAAERAISASAIRAAAQQ
ncbi:nicotinate-nucleotide adenylyltransferase [Rubritepida flocculans]|uniref:nicotinate-nucleotide adenylyltransferase n=1 Tax=Rubritepida flocculans TaxID=182403 RepID=UPI000422F95A|nr:nicotinate-nucleotide adenylyltransferase [Rubritepida flocculans]